MALRYLLQATLVVMTLKLGAHVDVLVIGEKYSTFSTADDLCRLQTTDRRVAESSYEASFISGAVRVGAVFDKRKTMSVAELHDRIHLTWSTPHVRDDEGASALRHQLVQPCRVDAAVFVAIGKNGVSSDIRNRTQRSQPRVICA